MRATRIGTVLFVLLALAAAGTGHAAAGDVGPGVETASGDATPAGTETACLVFRQADPDAGPPVQIRANGSEVEVHVNRSMDYVVTCPRPEHR